MKLLGIDHAERVADMIAIPFFLFASVYVWRIPQKTIVEYLILLFVITGFILDSVFTMDYLGWLSD